MNIRRSWGLFLLIALLLGGCFDSNEGNILPDAENLDPSKPSEPPDSTGPDPSGDTPADDQADPTGVVAGDEIPPVYIYNLPDRWNAAASALLEETENHDFGKFEVATSDESLVIHRIWGEEKNETYVHLTGYARKDDGRLERMYVRGKQADFGERHLELLQPYYEILMAVSNPGLSPGERSGLMRDLSLYGDVATLTERSNEDGKNSVEKDQIKYDVATIASSEGKTFALVVTMDAACNGHILSPCR